jgi:hypothetical protein
MLETTERDVAQSMLRLWGQDAAQRAAEYAARHQMGSNHDEAAKWQGVQRLIVQIRNSRTMAGIRRAPSAEARLAQAPQQS